MNAADHDLPHPPAALVYEDVAVRFVRIVPGKPERGLVPYYHFRILIDGEVEVGHLNLRIGNTKHVTQCAGHIGFAVTEAHRGNGYAAQACRAIAPFARTFAGTFIITCDPDNAASIRTIERLGARFLDKVTVPQDDPHYKSGSRQKRRYEWRPH